jgi:hypothetical protein
MLWNWKRQVFVGVINFFFFIPRDWVPCSEQYRCCEPTVMPSAVRPSNRQVQTSREISSYRNVVQIPMMFNLKMACWNPDIKWSSFDKNFLEIETGSVFFLYIVFYFLCHVTHAGLEVEVYFAVTCLTCIRVAAWWNLVREIGHFVVSRSTSRRLRA